MPPCPAGLLPPFPCPLPPPRARVFQPLENVLVSGRFYRAPGKGFSQHPFGLLKAICNFISIVLFSFQTRFCRITSTQKRWGQTRGERGKRVEQYILVLPCGPREDQILGSWSTSGGGHTLQAATGRSTQQSIPWIQQVLPHKPYCSMCLLLYICKTEFSWIPSFPYFFEFFSLLSGGCILKFIRLVFIQHSSGQEKMLW